MTTAIGHSWYMTLRHLRNLARQPWYIAFTLVQPVIYLLLFGELFKRVVDLPGFSTGSYITYLTPGMVIMSALFSAGWSGMGLIEDFEHGVLDRFLVSPVNRTALIAGRLIHLAVVTVIQSTIIIALGLIAGAQFPGGLPGVVVLVGCAILLAAGFGALSCGMALLVRKQESVIAAVNFILQPLTYLSTVFMASSLIPEWMQVVSRINPVNWAVEAGREVVAVGANWDLVVWRAGYLLVFMALCVWLSVRAFRTYQRSV